MEQIVRFGCIPENSIRDPTDNWSVTLEQRCEALCVAFANEGEQGFVGMSGKLDAKIVCILAIQRVLMMAGFSLGTTFAPTGALVVMA